MSPQNRPPATVFPTGGLGFVFLWFALGLLFLILTVLAVTHAGGSVSPTDTSVGLALAAALALLTSVSHYRAWRVFPFVAGVAGLLLTAFGALCVAAGTEGPMLPLVNLLYGLPALALGIRTLFSVGSYIRSALRAA